MTDKDDPLVPDDGQRPFGAKVIDLAGIRIAWGRPKNPSSRCEHRSLVYNDKERRIYCEDCQRTIEGYDAFMIVIREHVKMVSAAEDRLAKAKEALAATLIRRAAKALDLRWGRNMAPCCPHCRHGLLPEDFETGGALATSREMEIARRKRATPGWTPGGKT